MKVDGMDAINPTYQKPVKQENSNKTKEKIVETKNDSNVTNNLATKNISQISEQERKELKLPDKVLIEAIEKANKAISGANTEFHFSIHDKTKQIMVKVVNKDTQEVIREIPSEKVLDMVSKMWEMSGIMVDERR